MKRQLILLWATTSGRESVLLAAAAGFLLAGAAIADAQQPTPGAAAPATGTPKPQPKKPTPPAPAPAAAPAAPAPANPQATPQAQSDAQLVYTPWTKVCGPDGPPGSNAKQVCLTVMEARLETGQMIAGAAIVEPEGDPRKILRVTVPLGMQLPQGTRVIIDQGTPAQRPYEMCLAVGCMSDYDASIDMVSKLKSGQSLIIQAINSAGQPIGLSMPLADFAKAYDGPPTDQKALEEQQKKLQEELQRRAEETRKKLESKQPPPGPGGAATPAEK